MSSLLLQKMSYARILHANLWVGEDLTYLVIIKDAYLQTDDGHESIH